MTYEVERNMVVSTSHVTKEDIDKLSTPNGIITYSSIYWTQVHIDNEYADLSDYSDAFKKIYNFAKSEGFDNLKLDADGPQLNGFEVFDW